MDWKAWHSVTTKEKCKKLKIPPAPATKNNGNADRKWSIICIEILKRIDLGVRKILRDYELVGITNIWLTLEEQLLASNYDTTRGMSADSPLRIRIIVYKPSSK